MTTRHVTATCGNCGRSWCDGCDPTPSAMCHWCNGTWSKDRPSSTRCRARDAAKDAETAAAEAADEGPEDSAYGGTFDIWAGDDSNAPGGH